MKNNEEKKSSIFNDDALPVIGAKKSKIAKPVKILQPGEEKPKPVLNDDGTEKFAKKPNETLTLDTDITNQMKIVIPPIYYWEDVETDGTSSMMTMAFRWNNQIWGMSFPIEDENVVKISMARKKLFQIVKETLDVLIHHGDKVLDNHGIIDYNKVNDEEAIRWKLDPKWGQKVAAFNHLVRIAPITREKAIMLRLLDKPKVL